MDHEVDYFASIAEPLEDGSWINSNIARIVEIINDYDPELEVRWIPRDKRSPEDDVFQIVDKRINKVAFSVKDEKSFNITVLDRIFQADMSKTFGRPLTRLEQLDTHNNAVKLLDQKRRIDEAEEKRDLVAHIVGSPLNAYSHNGYRFDLHPSNQPKKEIFDVTVSDKTKSKETIWRPGRSTDN